MSSFLCSLRAFAKRREDKMSDEDKNKLHQKMMDLSKEWDSGEAFKNVKDAGWNNPETFEWLWEKYTHKSLDPSQNPPNFKDLRKFEFGLKAYNNLIAKKDGIIWSKFHLPRAAMQNVPELKRFETDLTRETSFFRDYTTATNKQVNELLGDFKELGLSLGGAVEDLPGIRRFSSAGQKTIRNLLDNIDTLQGQLKSTNNTITKNSITRKLASAQNDLANFYQNGSGRAFEILNSVLQGVDVESIDAGGVKLTAKQKNHLYNIKKNYMKIRTSGVTGLIRGLQKIKKMAKDKNLIWVDNTVERINSMIKSIEFQHRVDTEGRTINYKDMVDERQFLKLGFKPDERKSSMDKKLSFSPHYMSKYTLGILGAMKNLETAVDRSDLALDAKLDLELNKLNDKIADVAKSKSPIIDKQYDSDPYYFLKKYVSDVGIFNYKTHVKSTFKDALDTITKEHLNPAKDSGRKDLEESATSMIDLINDTYQEIQHIDPNANSFSANAMRALTSLTYFRLMGGNVRSAARNATQRLYEFVEFGFKAAAPMIGDAAKWYKNSGSSEDNMTKLIRQQKKRGIQWYDGKSKTSSIWGKDDSGMLSEQSRGAIEDAYMLEKDMYVDKNGELQIRQGSEGISGFAARKTTEAAVVGGKLHKIVEDWNRSSTFKTAFALAHQNLEASDRSWLVKKVLGKSTVNKIMKQKGENYAITYKDFQMLHGDKHEKVLNEWIENEAGQIAYNATVDLHFEYSKWAKAKAIRVRGNEAKGVQLAKAGLGQFAHYRFNMFNLMYNWAKEGGISLSKGDFTSQESWKLLRFGVLQAMVGSAFTGGVGLLGTATRADIAQLANNDVIQSGEVMYAWLSSNKEKFEEGEISEETKKWFEDLTYGQGIKTFLGPNLPLALSTYEYLMHSTIDSNPDISKEWKDALFNKPLEKALKKNENKEMYDKIAMINSQAARTYAYTTSAWKAGGIKDAIWLELGFFQKKNQREWSKWLFGTGKKKKGMPVMGNKRKSLSDIRRQEALAALSRLGG